MGLDHQITKERQLNLLLLTSHQKLAAHSTVSKSVKGIDFKTRTNG